MYYAGMDAPMPSNGLSMEFKGGLDAGFRTKQNAGEQTMNNNRYQTVENSVNQMSFNARIAPERMTRDMHSRTIEQKVNHTPENGEESPKAMSLINKRMDSLEPNPKLGDSKSRRSFMINNSKTSLRKVD